MEHALLTSYLVGRTLTEDFARAIKQEVGACEDGIRSPANVGYIIISDGPQFIVTREHIERLLESMFDETLPWMSANYIGNCLIMSDDFEPADSKVAEAIEFVADESRLPTGDEIREAIKALA